ncbi:unnamed protein product (macronuclear) [Paramecium tetraurelia]|uniref:Uncharacterized protein n=1 Tax=Paramecium tetraurelia TaxID=5888 RepID=A0BQR5_PARTE|nr:uncharacterized protein GSPATT00031111001 [Paramecium tetraurelia]CAK60882.1 unnamed protein product [Paramecium tetraurelia]|eukprot:XP_001428280.1 hypothetical protein (macronuclear) [Paramecium tetraurelia strain d4-2]
MADEYFLEHNESYSAFSFGDIQFFVNLNDFEAPIFQPSKIHNPYASLIGNYCIPESSIFFINKVDPIFVVIRLLRNKLANEQQAKSIEFENIFDNEDAFQIYLSKCKSIRENFDSISITKEVGDELYVKLDKGRLFQFLDAKYNNIRQYSQQGIYYVNDCNQKKQDEFELQACILFKQYMGDQLFNEFEAARKLIVLNQIANSKVVLEQVDRDEKADRVDKENQQKKNTNQEKLKASETKTLEAGKKCHKLDSFCNKNKELQQKS